MSQYLYAIRVERLTYGGLQILQVKIGRTNDVKRTLRGYKRSHPDAEILNLWHPNPNLDVATCEKGIHELAGKYAYQREREIFTFLQESYNKFSKNASLLLEDSNTHERKPKTTPVTSAPRLTSDNGTYIVEFIDNTKPTGEIIGYDQTEAMVKATDYLIDNHGLVQKIEIPWVPGRSKAIINDSEEWDRADAVYKRLKNGYYVDTKLSNTSKQREIKRMAQACGVDVNFRGDW